MDFSIFEKAIGISFKDKTLLKQAFIHRSYLNENKGATGAGGAPLEHNERLEFLGDAVLELISTIFLYKKYPARDEGDLTAYRSALVNAVTLSGIAAKLGMDDYLLLSRGEGKDKGKARQIILANTMEALIGAMYLDQGHEVTERFVHKHILTMIDDVVASGAFVDAKSSFQEKAQEVEGVTPSYKVLRQTGPDHDKHFTVGLYLNTDKIAEGEGKSKQEAEQRAAEAALAAKGW